MKKMNFYFLLIVLTLLALGLTSNNLSWAGEKKVPIEGIAYEPQDPSKSLVIIDGEDYQKGSQYEGQEIVEVLQDRVRMKSPDGKISEFRIQGGNPARSSSSTNLTDSSKKTDSENPVENIWQQFKNKFGVDAASLLNYAAEIAVKADLRNLYSQANAAMMESGNENAMSLDKMIDQGMINPAFKEGKNGYQYRVESGSQGVQVYADPMNGSEKSNHFMIDDWGNMRVELGKPATSKSPLAKLPANLDGLVPKMPQAPPSSDEMESHLAQAR